MYEDSGTHVLLGRRLVVSRKPLGRLGAAADVAAATSLQSHFDINETLVLSAALSVEAALSLVTKLTELETESTLTAEKAAVRPRTGD